MTAGSGSVGQPGAFGPGRPEGGEISCSSMPGHNVQVPAALVATTSSLARLH